MNLQVDSASRLSLGVNLPTVVFVPAIKRKRTTPIAEVTPKRKNPKETTRGNRHGGHREGGISRGGISRASQAPCGWTIEASMTPGARAAAAVRAVAPAGVQRRLVSESRGFPAGQLEGFGFWLFDIGPADRPGSHL